MDGEEALEEGALDVVAAEMGSRTGASRSGGGDGAKSRGWGLGLVLFFSVEVSEGAAGLRPHNQSSHHFHSCHRHHPAFLHVHASS